MRRGGPILKKSVFADRSVETERTALGRNKDGEEKKGKVGKVEKQRQGERVNK